jgi:hypothetical protein
MTSFPSLVIVPPGRAQDQSDQRAGQTMIPFPSSTRFDRGKSFDLDGILVVLPTTFVFLRKKNYDSLYFLDIYYLTNVILLCISTRDWR